RVSMKSAAAAASAARRISSSLAPSRPRRILSLIEFRDVSFGFGNSSQGLHNVSFSVKAGQTVAIVGPNGAGKTTLVKLLQRVYDAQGGKILVDG
ncbi:ATP-binding cassette domain-containing protein, partial [Rhizobium ruizarguesonis]